MKLLIIPHWVRATLARYGRSKEAVLDEKFMRDAFSRKDIASFVEAQHRGGDLFRSVLQLGSLNPSYFINPNFLPDYDERDMIESLNDDDEHITDLLIGRSMSADYHLQFYANNFTEIDGKSIIAVDVCAEKLDMRSKLIGDKKFVESLICKLYENQCSMVDLVDSGLIFNYTKRIL